MTEAAALYEVKPAEPPKPTAFELEYLKVRRNALLMEVRWIEKLLGMQSR